MLIGCSCQQELAQFEVWNIFDLDAFYSKWVQMRFSDNEDWTREIRSKSSNTCIQTVKYSAEASSASITETRDEVILMQLRCSRSKSTIVAFEARVSRAFSKAGTYGRKCKQCNSSGNLHDVIAFSNRFKWCVNTTSSRNKDRGLAILVQWKHTGKVKREY